MSAFVARNTFPAVGPDGGDGGDGGNVWLIGDEGINTLADFQARRKFRAEHGVGGAGKDRTGARGGDVEIPVPCGTRVVAKETAEFMGEVVSHGARLLVAAGGQGGKGNTRFKSSTNRAPRQSTPGTPGESRDLRLELTVLADVGLLGLPNAGKSTLIRQVSAARPKVADYPFTTLYPNLGVVALEAHRSFVMADIPGLIEGAAEGAGLGIRFLKHLRRTRILLHLVDVCPPGDEVDPVADCLSIVNELENFSPELAAKERWLVLNKTDLVSADELATLRARIVEALDWKGTVYEISALAGEGTRKLTGDLMNRLEEIDRAADDDSGAGPEL